MLAFISSTRMLAFISRFPPSAEPGNLFAGETEPSFDPRRQASSNRSWQSNNGTFRASGMAGIEPMPTLVRVTGANYVKGAVKLRPRMQIPAPADPSRKGE